MMKKIVFFVLILVATELLPSLLFSQAKIEVVGGTNFDFGEVSTGNIVKRTVTLKNIGTDTLNVDEVSTSCGCTATLLSKNRIPPKGNGTLEISFDSKKFSGKVEKAVTFETNDPEHNKVRIIFTANVSKVLEMTPDHLVFNVVKLDTSNIEEITLSNVGDKPIRITNITSNSTEITFELAQKEIGPGAQGIIKCNLQPTVTGIKKGEIHISTDNAKVPELVVKYFALAKEKNAPKLIKP
ncbi:MAG: DUF1573 domain-containing protein [Ignavibacteriae bacterium]|nr:DUF1573 domain-containing protein [Ignavibacteriota bacterium]